ncbi:acetyltransferase (GNAT) family protein [Plasticicumulans lactativorans]|uniref:Acetyltransferase (GNAT) family protein n=1 Tax=Plasticicumulans lactativorans TaxID=1133106 RepID=A0A4R2L0D4_9GAMM|nr:GNAT family N-acetyltransferase [Plasticicumulans lactativorans]TCO80461.1 acetyltransferase (GNAT) family protein [Plasticicumulans lactativorans]
MHWSFHSASAFLAHQETWNQLNRACADSPLLHSDFIAPLLHEFGDSDLRLAVAHENSEPVAMTLLGHPRFAVWETFQPSQLPIGPWICASHVDPMKALESLARALPKPLLALGLTQLDPQITPRPVDSDKLSTLDYIDTARIAVSGSFTDYWGSRGKNLRQNLQKQSNRLEREGIQVRLEVLTEAADMARAVNDYGNLESVGWKAASNTAIHSDNAQGRFYKTMLEAFCRRYAGRVYRYLYDEKVVASDLCVTQGGALVVLKTTYDETIKTSSPAMLMRRAYFEKIFKEGHISRIEFYGRVMEWHTRLTDDTRRLYHVTHLAMPRVAAVLQWLRGSQGKDAAALTNRESEADVQA